MTGWTVLGDLAKEGSVKEGYKPFDYQKPGIKRFADNGVVILAYPTGAGKTPSAVFAMEAGKKANRAKKALVVVPTGLRTNFANTVKGFSDASVQVFGNMEEQRDMGFSGLGSSKPSDYSVVGYELFRMNPAAFLAASQADTLIFDEYHRLRNKDTKTFSAAKAIRPHVQNFIGLTATPTANEVSEMAPLIGLASNFSHPLSDKRFFKARYSPVIGNEKGFFGGKHNVRGLVRQEELQLLLGDLVHYVDPKDVQKAFPSKRMEYVDVEMSPLQKNLYGYAMGKVDPLTARKIREGLPVSASEAKNIFKVIQGARGVSNSVSAMNRYIPLEASAQLTPKVRKILDDAEQHLKETPDGKIVMYSNNIKNGIDVLAAGLNARGVPFGMFLGKGVEMSGRKVTEESRQGDANLFRSGELKVLLMSSAGAEGIDLPDGTMFQGLEGHFNPIRVDQPEGRIRRAKGLSHRAPEDRFVIIKRYRSVLPDRRGFLGRLLDLQPRGERTTDQWVYETAEAKKRLTNMLESAISGRPALREEIPKVDVPLKSLDIESANKVISRLRGRVRLDEQMGNVIPTATPQPKIIAPAVAIPTPIEPKKVITDKQAKTYKYLNRTWDNLRRKWKYEYPEEGMGG